MNKKIILVLLSSIIFIAIAFRFIGLGAIPASPDWDEASLGYNAYSLLQTGRDEYGAFMPVVFRSFDDYKPALYSYIDIPFIAIFDLTTFAVRLPSAILGVIAVFLTYLLVKELFWEEKKTIRENSFSEILALASAFFLAISPWHIQFSRVAFEANLGLTLLIFALLFFLKSLHKKHWYLYASAVFFGLSIYAYQSEKVLAPLFMLLLIITFRKKIFLLPRKYIFSALVTGFIVIFPMIVFIISNPNSLSRASGVSVFNNPNSTIERMKARTAEDGGKNDFIGLALDNRRVAYIPVIIGNYLSHFDLNWLFITGDKTERHQPPNMGHLYIFELLLLLVGVYSLLFGKYTSEVKILIFGWILLTPIPSSITWDVPNAVRTITFLPMIQIIIAYGFLSLILYCLSLKKKKLLVVKSFLGIYLVLMIINIAYFANQYFIQYNYFSAQQWQYGYKDAVSYVKTVQSKYTKIIVSDEQPMDQSYIFFLYYLKFSPSLYQKSDNKRHSFDKYEFHPVRFTEGHTSDTLYIGRPIDFPEDVSTQKTIQYPDGTIAIKIVKG